MHLKCIITTKEIVPQQRVFKLFVKISTFWTRNYHCKARDLNITMKIRLDMTEFHGIIGP